MRSIRNSAGRQAGGVAVVVAIHKHIRKCVVIEGGRRSTQVIDSQLGVKRHGAAGVDTEVTVCNGIQAVPNIVVAFVVARAAAVAVARTIRIGTDVAEGHGSIGSDESWACGAVVGLSWGRARVHEIAARWNRDINAGLIPNNGAAIRAKAANSGAATRGCAAGGCVSYIASTGGSDATVNTCSEGDGDGAGASCTFGGGGTGVATDTNVVGGTSCYWELAHQ